MDPIDSTLPSSLFPTTQPQQAGSTGLSQEEFFSIMITELTNQDPLEPMDNSEFLSQVTQLQTLETMTNLSEGIEALLLGQQLSSAGALIGKAVSGISADGLAVNGTVDRIVVQGGEVVLGMGDQSMPLSRVLEIKGEENAG